MPLEPALAARVFLLALDLDKQKLSGTRYLGFVLRGAVLVNAIPVVALGTVMMSLSVRPRIPEIFAALAVVFSTVVTASAGFHCASRAGADLFRAYGAGRLQRFLRL